MITKTEHTIINYLVDNWMPTLEEFEEEHTNVFYDGEDFSAEAFKENIELFFKEYLKEELEDIYCDEGVETSLIKTLISFSMDPVNWETIGEEIYLAIQEKNQGVDYD